MRPKTQFMLALTAGAALALPQAAMAQKTASGTSNGVTWQAESRIVGVGSTATIAGGGSAAYLADRPQKNGVVALIMQRTDGTFICSGSLMNGGRQILTAAHCVSDGAGTANPIKTTAYFYGGPNQDQFYNVGATTIDVASYNVNAGYTGEVIDQNDIAVLTLKDFAPAFATQYSLATESDLTGLDFNVAGYGVRSLFGGSVGGTPANTGPGRLRQGFNTYDFRLGDADFGGFFTDVDPGTGENFFGTASIGYSYLSDFDNGLAGNNASCLLAAAFGLGGAKYCDTGLGFGEVSVAGGDSGGPEFVNGKIASVTSYGLSFGQSFGDVDGKLNSSFGEFNGFVPVWIHGDFLASALGSVPEPASWAMMLAGFGMVGGAVRRSRRTLTAQAA